MRTLLFVLAAIALGHKWHCHACGHENPATTISPIPELNKCWSSYYKAIIFLVDGSTSMGNGTFIQANGTPVDWSKNWTTYNKWKDIKGLVNSFIGVISNNFTVVMKQFSSKDYTNWCCPLCPKNMTRVLKAGQWTNATWEAASEAVYTQLQNCDTHTYTAVIDTVTVWDRKRKELNYTNEDRALIILITDGEPSEADLKFNTTAVQMVKNSPVDLFLVYPNFTTTSTTRNQRMEDLKKLVNDPSKEAISFDFANSIVDTKLRDSIVERVCDNIRNNGG